MSTGKDNFNTVGLSLNIPSVGTKPVVPLTIYRLHEKPYSVGDSLFKHYWIWRNWTTAKSFAAMDSITFKSVEVNSSDLSNPANYSLYARPVSSYTNDWILTNRKATDTDIASNGTVSFSGTSLVNFGQLILSRKANPCLQNRMINMPLDAKRVKIQATGAINTQGNVMINLNKK